MNLFVPRDGFIHPTRQNYSFREIKKSIPLEEIKETVATDIPCDRYKII